MLYNGVFGCHGNTCYVIVIGAIFYMLYSIGPINVCTDFEINQYKIDEVRKYAKIVFYLTSRDIYSIGPITVCTDFEINRYKIYEVRIYAKIVFYLTSRDAKTLCHASWGL